MLHDVKATTTEPCGKVEHELVPCPSIAQINIYLSTLRSTLTIALCCNIAQDSKQMNRLK